MSRREEEVRRFVMNSSYVWLFHLYGISSLAAFAFVTWFVIEYGASAGSLALTVITALGLAPYLIGRHLLPRQIRFWPDRLEFDNFADTKTLLYREIESVRYTKGHLAAFLMNRPQGVITLRIGQHSKKIVCDMYDESAELRQELFHIVRIKKLDEMKEVFAGKRPVEISSTRSIWSTWLLSVPAYVGLVFIFESNYWFGAILLGAVALTFLYNVFLCLTPWRVKISGEGIQVKRMWHRTTDYSFDDVSLIELGLGWGTESMTIHLKDREKTITLSSVAPEYPFVRDLIVARQTRPNVVGVTDPDKLIMPQFNIPYTNVRDAIVDGSMPGLSDKGESMKKASPSDTIQV